MFYFGNVFFTRSLIANVQIAILCCVLANELESTINIVEKYLFYLEESLLETDRRAKYSDSAFQI